jgi:hypothetical protein
MPVKILSGEKLYLKIAANLAAFLLTLQKFMIRIAARQF